MYTLYTLILFTLLPLFILFTLFIVFKLLDTAFTVACMPDREGWNAAFGMGWWGKGGVDWVTGWMYPLYCYDYSGTYSADKHIFSGIMTTFCSHKMINPDIIMRFSSWSIDDFHHIIIIDFSHCPSNCLWLPFFVLFVCWKDSLTKRHLNLLYLMTTIYLKSRLKAYLKNPNQN